MQVAQGVVIFSRPAVGDGAVVVGRRIYRIHLYGLAEIGLRADKIVQVILGYPAEKIRFVKRGVGFYQEVEYIDGLRVFIVDKKLPAAVEEIHLVVLGLCMAQRETHQRRQCDNMYVAFSFHIASL